MRLRLALCFLLCAASMARAANPRGVIFVVSDDHNTVNNNGPAVQRYDLEIYTSTGLAPVRVIDLGKPAPSATNEITFLELQPVLDMLTPGPYVLKVAAVGPGGAGRTPATSVFTVGPASPCTTLTGSEVEVLILAFETVSSRSNPLGTLIRYDASSSAAIVKIDIDLEGDGEPAITYPFMNERANDGRYNKAFAPKFTVNGTWPLVVTATDALGRSGSTRCTPGITVGF